MQKPRSAKSDGIEIIQVEKGYFAITITGEIRIPGENWCPDDSEVQTDGRYKKIPEHLLGLQDEKLRAAIKGCG